MSKIYIDKLAFIYIKDNKVLETLSYGKDTWYIPGGKREAGETDTEALMREVQEELSVSLVPESIRHYGTFEAQTHGKPQGTVVRLTCYTANFTGTLQPSSEVEKIAYFAYADKHKTSPVDHLVFDDLKQKGIIL